MPFSGFYQTGLPETNVHLHRRQRYQQFHTQQQQLAAPGRGSRQGVRPNMGVISDGGIVGIVRNTTEHFSQVMSVLHSQYPDQCQHPQFQLFLDAHLGRQRPRFMQLNAIPRYAEFKVGDIIESNGFSQIFPPVLSSALSAILKRCPVIIFKIQVNWSNDMAKVRYVYVVNNLMRYEHDELDKATDE